MSDFSLGCKVKRIGLNAAYLLYTLNERNHAKFVVVAV